MRVFITGASGFIGNAVANAFARAGHEVMGLIRSSSQAKKLLQEEIEPVIGDLSKPDSYLPKAKNAEVLVHCAMEYSPDGVKRDAQTIDAFLQTVSDIPKTFLYTSGCWSYGNSPKLKSEFDPPTPLKYSVWRTAHENKVLQSASKNLRTVVLRPGCVFGGSGSLTAYWFSTIESGSVKIVGKGDNFWSMVHKDGLAEAYVLAAEKEISGVILNVGDSSQYTVRQMAEAVARVGGIPGKVSSYSEQEAEKLYGDLVEGLLADQKVSSERIMMLLGWRPRHLGFVDGIERYYAAWKELQ